MALGESLGVFSPRRKEIRGSMRPTLWDGDQLPAHLGKCTTRHFFFGSRIGNSFESVRAVLR
jgi:hypothetical protein